MQETRTENAIAWTARLVAFVVAVTMVTSTFVLLAPNAAAKTGGPDTFGYNFTDSTESDGKVSYDWIDILSTGTSIGNPGDYVTSAFDMGFTITYYGEDYDEFYLGGDNGWFTFDAPSVSYAWVPYLMPWTGIGGTMLSPYWQDYRYCASGADIKYETLGTAPDRKLVITWNKMNMYYYCSSSDTTTFQAIVYENGNIVFQYQDGTFYGAGSYETVSIGIQAKGGDGLSYAYSQMSSSYNNKAIMFYPPPPPVDQLKLDSPSIPDPFSLADANTMSTNVINKGTDTQIDVGVNAKVFSTAVNTVIDEDFDSGPGDFTSSATHGADLWTGDINDSQGAHVSNYNYGDDYYNDGDTSDRSMSSGRKEAAVGGMFDDSTRLHHDGTYLYVSDRLHGQIWKFDSSNSGTVVIQGLTNPLDVTTDSSGNIYVIGRCSGIGYLYCTNTWVKKFSSTGTLLWTTGGSTIKYGTGITYYDGQVFALQVHFQTANTKIVKLDADDGSLDGAFTYGNGKSRSYYWEDLDVDDDTGDIWMIWRHYSQSTLRKYTRSTGGSYSANSYTDCQYNGAGYLYYSSSVDVYEGSVYTSGYYYTSFYGGLKKISTTSCSWSTVVSDYGGGWNTYVGSIAMTDTHVYVSSMYHFREYYFYNAYDKVGYYDLSDGSLDKVLGPQDAMLSHLTTPSIDASTAVGMTLKFKHSYFFYFRYEGAIMEASTDGGTTWEYIEKDKFTTGGYVSGVNGQIISWYNTPEEVVMKQAFTYYAYAGGMGGFDAGCRQECKWDYTEVDLTDYTGYPDVKVRWTVAYNQYWYSSAWLYYNSYFRLDDVSVDLIDIDQTFLDETKTIASIAFKETAAVAFTPFTPSVNGLKSGDMVGVSMAIIDDYGDEDLSDNRFNAFRDVKFVIFSENFDDCDASDWIFGRDTSGASIWSADSNDATSAPCSLDSGRKYDQTSPGDPWASTPNLDLKMPVSAELTFQHSYYFYYTYDGVVVEISEDGGETWDSFAPVGGYTQSIYNYAYYANPLRGYPAFSFYGSAGGSFTYTPSPQAWEKKTFDLTPYVGQDDVRIRWHIGWSSVAFGTYSNGFYRLDDLAITGVVYSDNLAISAPDVVDPIPINGAPDIGTTVINAGVNSQISGTSMARVTIGTEDVTNLIAEDHDSYTASNHPWTASYTTPGSSWSSQPGWTFPSGQDGFDGSDAWGPGNSNGGEFAMYYAGGEGFLVTDSYDLSSAPDDAKMTMQHRWNFHWTSGMGYNPNGGIVEISTDYDSSTAGSETWTKVVPTSGYNGQIYNYAGWGNPLFGEMAFVGTSGGSSAWPDGDWVESEFSLADYIGEDNVAFRFHFGFWDYMWPYDGEKWVIDNLNITGTDLADVVYQNTVTISGDGTGGAFAPGEAKDLNWNYHFSVPGQYKVRVEAWIDGYLDEDGNVAVDEFPGDNKRDVSRETMFTVAYTDAEAEKTCAGCVNGGTGDLYADGWSTTLAMGTADWHTQTSEVYAGAASWGLGDDTFGTAYNGDDARLNSPSIDLSQATSSKMVFKHRYAFYASVSAFAAYYYEGGNVDISTAGPDGSSSTRSIVTPTQGNLYGGTIYNYLYYGNPLNNLPAFVSASGGWTESQARLDTFTGTGMDDTSVSFHLGGAYPDWDPAWFVDEVGIYALGFDIEQTSSSLPYKLELGEGSTITTSFKNVGMGDLGTGGPISSADIYAYAIDSDGNTVWSDSSYSISNLPMASETGTFSISFPGISTPGMYTIGVKLATPGTSDTLKDLFGTNNVASHMLLVGTEQDLGTPLLTGGENWVDVADEPASVGDGALSVSWDETDVVTDDMGISIVGQSSGYSPGYVEAILGTTVTWTNDDTITHTVTSTGGDWPEITLAAGESASLTFSEVGTFTYYCSVHPMMAGTIVVVAAAIATEQARTNYVPLWTDDSYLMFWANYDMSAGNEIMVFAQQKGHSFDSGRTVALWSPNGFTIVDGNDHSDVGGSLTGDSDGWNPYYIHLDTSKLGLNGMDYDPAPDNQYSFVFQAKGPLGSASIGGVKVVRTLDHGLFWDKVDHDTRVYEIYPSLGVDVIYTARNIGTLANVLEITPALVAGGSAYDTTDWSIYRAVTDSSSGAPVTTSSIDGTTSIPLDADQQVTITLSIWAPDFDWDTGEPAGNREFDIKLNGKDTANNADMDEPLSASLFIRPPQFSLTGISVDRLAVLEGDDNGVTIRVTAENDGNYAQDVLVVFYVYDPKGGKMVSFPDGMKRVTRIGDTEIARMAPTAVLSEQKKVDNKVLTYSTASVTWIDPFIPEKGAEKGNGGEYWDVTVYAQINPTLETEDIADGRTHHDEFLNQQDDNVISGTVSIVAASDSTPSFALTLFGLSMASLLAGLGVALRRREDA